MDVPTLIGGQPNAALLKYMGKVCRLMGLSAGMHEPEELFQDAVVMLLRKAHLYDPARGKPTTFANLVCRSAMAVRAKRWNRRADHDPGRSARFEARGTDVPVDDRTPDPADVAERAELVTVILAAVASLPDDQRDLLTRRFGLDGHPPARLDDLRSGRKRQNVSYRVGVALELLRWRMGVAS